jgi:hypothetical protein
MGARRESKTSPRRIEAAQKQKQSLELRMAGASFDQIGQALGYSSPSSAYRAVMAALAKVPEPEVKSYRIVNVERLNKLRLNNWQSAQNGDPKAIEVELKIQQEEARLLGLYAPTKTEWAGESGGPVQLRVIYDDDAPTNNLHGKTP